ncbi:TPA: hypothetical protein ACTUO9_002023 [Legionella anisa]
MINTNEVINAYMMKQKPLFFLFIIFLLLMFTFQVNAESRKISKDGYFGCKSREYKDKLTQYAIDQDADAFKNALKAGILIGECTIFNEGEEVFVSDTAIFSAGLVKVRRKGEMLEYWTNMEAIKSN